MRTSSRNVAVVLFDEVELLDVAGAVQALTLSGRHWNFRPFRVHCVAKSPGLVETRSQVRLEAVYGFERCPEPEILLVPGGYGARRAANDAELVAWVGQALDKATLVLAVSWGALIVAKTGKLANAVVAATTETGELLREIEPSISIDHVRRIVVSGRTATAASSTGGIDLGLFVVARVLGPKQALSVAQKLGYDWRGDGAPDLERIEILPRVE